MYALNRREREKMLESTIATIRMLAEADPETDAETVSRIVAACKPQRKRRDLINAKEACSILGLGSRMTLYNWMKRGIVHPIRFTARKVRYDRYEIESIATNGVS